MNYELKIEQFSGPLDKLLELIEERKLQITEISLGQVTQNFLAHIEELTEKNRELFRSEAGLRLLADFISVASRLIFLKSKSLLPDVQLTSKEEGEIKDLEGRLRLYRELKPAVKYIALAYQGAKPQFGRPYFFGRQFAGFLRTPDGEGGAGIFYPGRDLNVQSLQNSIAKIFETISNLELESETIREKVISLEEKIKEIISFLKIGTQSKLSDLSRAKDRSEIIVIFLAILHLAREQLLELEQESHFSDILIKKR